MNMIERVARAICKASGHDPDGPTCDVYVEGDPVAGIPWAGYRKAARDVVKAMRAPPEYVIWAGAAQLPIGTAFVDAQDVWHSMLDAALNEEEKNA